MDVYFKFKEYIEAIQAIPFKEMKKNKVPEVKVDTPNTKIDDILKTNPQIKKCYQDLLTCYEKYLHDHQLPKKIASFKEVQGIDLRKFTLSETNDIKTQIELLSRSNKED